MFHTIFFLSVFRDRSELEYYNDPKSYPLSCWLPFILHEKWMFLIFFFCQCLVLVFVAILYLGIDTFFFGTIYAIGGQIEMLNFGLDNIENYLIKSEWVKILLRF